MEEQRQSFAPWLMSPWVPVVIGCLAYLGALHGPFVHDDFPQIVNNPYLDSWSSAPLFFGRNFWVEGWGVSGSATYYRPLFMLWLLICKKLFGMNTVLWHASSVALHGVATFLLFRMTQRLTRSEVAAWVAALLFAVHPSHVEAVIWLSSSGDLLGAIAAMAAVLCFLRVADDARWRRWSVATAAVFAGAVLSKEALVLFPIVLVALWWVRGRDRRQLTASVAAIAVAVAYVALRFALLHTLGAARSQVSTSTILLTTPSILLFYVRQFVAPITLSLFYDSYYVSNVSTAAFIVPVLILLGIAAAAFFSRKKQPYVAVGLLWALLTIAPTLDLRVFYWREIVHDRYLYIPSIGLAVVIGVAVAAAAKRWSAPALRMIALTAALVLAVVTVNQSSYWSSALLLYSHAVQVAPNNVGANMMIAETLQARGDLNDAIRFYEHTAMLAPNWPDPEVSLARLYARAGQRQLAIAHMQRAMQIAPGAPLEREMQALQAPAKQAR